VLHCSPTHDLDKVNIYYYTVLPNDNKRILAWVMNSSYLEGKNDGQCKR